MRLEPGAFVGPYQITAHLGSGGMGDVYRARDPKLQRDVAIKVLPEAFAPTPIESRASNVKRRQLPPCRTPASCPFTISAVPGA